MPWRLRTVRPGHAVRAALIVVGTFLAAAPAEAQYETWYSIPTVPSMSVSARWLDTASMERSGATRVRVWVASVDPRGLVTESRRGVDESHDRIESRYVVNCENGQYQLIERKYLLKAVVMRRDQYRLANWSRPDVISESACRHAGMELPSDTRPPG